VELDVPIYIHPHLAPEAVRQAYFADLPPDASRILETAGWGWWHKCCRPALKMSASRRIAAPSAFRSGKRADFAVIGVLMRNSRFIAPVQSFTTGVRTELMKDFSNASFPPEIIGIMEEAIDAAVRPCRTRSAHAQSIAETILRTVKDRERGPATLQRMALLELQITPRH
jgi:hypothetical protein